MQALSSKVIAVVLALAVPAAAHVCLCMNMPQRAVQRDDAHACCNKNVVKHVPASQSPVDCCKKCNLRKPHTMAVAAKDASFLPAFDLTIFVPVVQVAVEPRLCAFALIDDVPIPPLLQDLLHTHCQLTV